MKNFVILTLWLGFAWGCTGESADPPPEAGGPEVADRMKKYMDEPFIHRSELLEPKAAPDFRLINQEGKEVTLADFKDKVLLVGFIYTSCPDICRNITATYLGLQKEFASEVGKELGLVLITTDPTRDTPERMKSYTEKFGGRWTFLTGKGETLKTVWESYRVSVREDKDTARNEHTWMVVLVDRGGLIRIRYMGQDVPLKMMTGDIRNLLEDKP